MKGNTLKNLSVELDSLVSDIGVGYAKTDTGERITIFSAFAIFASMLCPWIEIGNIKYLGLHEDGFFHCLVACALMILQVRAAYLKPRLSHVYAAPNDAHPALKRLSLWTLLLGFLGLTAGLVILLYYIYLTRHVTGEIEVCFGVYIAILASLMACVGGVWRFAFTESGN